MGEGVERLTAALAASRTDAERVAAAAALARYLAGVGRLAEAAEAAGEALRVAESAHDRRGLALALHAQGTVSYHRDDYVESMRDLSAALEHAEDIADFRVQAAVLATTGMVLAHLGQPTRAIERLVRALTVAGRVGGDGEVECEVFLGLARVYARLDEPERALGYAHRALDLARARDDVTAVVTALRTLGNVYAAETERRAALGLPIDQEGRRAIAWYEDALPQARKLGDRTGELLIVNNTSHVLRFIGRERDAVDLIEAVLGGEDLEGARPVLLALLYYNLGDSRLRLGQPEVALPVLREALRLAESHQSREHLPKMHLALADAYERIGDTQQALVHHKAYHEVERVVRGEEVRRNALLAAVKLEKEELTQESSRIREERKGLVQEFNSLSDRADLLGDQVRRDVLTGLANRLAFDEWLAGLVDCGEQAPVSVALLDLDRFKSINDGFSHIVGDEVLRRVGRLIAAVVRQGDLVARYGGEEFGMVLPATSLDEAAAVCDRVRRAVAEADWASIRAGLDVTVSVGVAQEESAERALALADQRLYTAKRSGRNRVVAY